MSAIGKIGISLGNGRLAQLTDDLDDHVGDLARVRNRPVQLGRQEMKDAVRQLASRERIRPVETFSGGEKTLADLIGLEGHQPAVTLANPIE